MTGPQRTATALLVWLSLWMFAGWALISCSPVDGECGGETSCSEVRP